jgi:hypothetical protein
MWSYKIFKMGDVKGDKEGLFKLECFMSNDNIIAQYNGQT